MRLGDYVGFFNIVPKDYYTTCLTMLPDGVKNVYVFSNDIKEAIKILTDVGTGFFNIHFIENLDEVETLYSMARMKYGGICANSSFSWWGAWLNQSTCKKIFMPKIWLGDAECNDVHFENSIII